MTASPEYVFAAVDVPEDPDEPEPDDDEPDDDEPDEPEDPAVAWPSEGCWPDESPDEAADEPDDEPELSEVLLLVVTGRASAATSAVELREVL
jgi:hypothetical protein